MSRNVIVAVVDYGMGNLFSVQNACARAGLASTITSSARDVEQADAVILPGVGAFGDAMATLRDLGMVSALRDVAATGKPLVGICLGMQLLMTESSEFGVHAGLDLVHGFVSRLPEEGRNGLRVKVPHVGWNRLYRPADAGDKWRGTLLDGMVDGVFMYFVHSYRVEPAHADATIATTTYGTTEFCSALQWNNIFACQAHPERSGVHGLTVYRNLAAVLDETRRERHENKSHPGSAASCVAPGGQVL